MHTKIRKPHRHTHTDNQNTNTAAEHLPNGSMGRSKYTQNTTQKQHRVELARTPQKLPLPRAKLDSTPPSQGRVTVLSREPKLTAKQTFKQTPIPATVGAKFMHAQY